MSVGAAPHLTASLRLAVAAPGIVEAALAPEADDGPDGTTATLRCADTLEVDITAKDLSGLRAALHGMIRLADAADRVGQAGAQPPSAKA